MLNAGAWHETLHAAADALDAARWDTKSEEVRIGLGDSRFARELAEQWVGLFAFQSDMMPEYAIQAADRFRARVLEQALPEWIYDGLRLTD
jgi:hypothetical protein